MTGYIGTSGGRKEIKEIFVGTASGRKQVERAWVGTAAGNKVWYERFALTTALTATPASTSQINLTWSASQGCTYQLHRTAGPTTGPLPNGSTALAYSDMGLPPNTTCSYRLDVYRNGVLVGSPTASAKTAAVTTQQKTVTLSAVETASYNGAGANRGVGEMYFGYYSGTNGVQKSQFRIAVPADLRNCVSVDKVEVSIMGRHTYPNGGTTVSLVVHHNTSLGGSFGGSTATVTDRSIGKPGYFGGSEWADVTSNYSVGRYTVAEEFRAHGAQGFGLMSPGGSTSQSFYGYADGGTSPRVRFHYTIRTA